MKTPLVCVAAVLACLATGCSTSNYSAASSARIQEKSEAFAKLSPAQQKTIQDGFVERGYTPDMVYMVLGKPTTVTSKDARGGKLEMWTYIEYGRPHSGAQDTRNNPDSSHYTTQTIATVSAEVREAPGLGSPPDQVTPAKFSATSAAMGQLNVADLERNKVYLFFANGRVTEIKLESEG